LNARKASIRIQPGTISQSPVPENNKAGEKQ